MNYLTDPEERFQLFEDLISVLMREPSYDVQVFCQDKGLSFDDLEKILKYYRRTSDHSNPLEELKKRIFSDRRSNLVFKIVSRGGYKRELYKTSTSFFECDYIVFLNAGQAFDYALSVENLNYFDLHHVDHLLRSAAVAAINKRLEEEEVQQELDFPSLIEWEHLLRKSYGKEGERFGFYFDQK